MIKIIFIIASILSLYSGSQIAVANDRWQLIGINSIYVEGLIPPIWGANGFILDNDINADGNPSYAYKQTVKTGAEEFEEGNATIGLLGIRNAFSPTGATELILGATVAIEKTDFNDYVPNRPRFRMYLAGRDNAPAIRIDYQSDLEGQELKVRFGSEDLYYKAYFDKDNTYSNPQALSIYTLTIDNTINDVEIIDMVDNNLSDNNISKLLSNELDGELNSSFFTAGGVGGREANITVYGFSDDGAWEIYDSRNTNTNKITKFSTGRGYWIKMTNEHYSDTSKHGIVVGDGGVSSDRYNSVGNGWNLLSFNDSDIRYSPTAMFLPAPALGTNINIAYKFNINSFTIAWTNPLDFSRNVNWISERLRTTEGSVMKLRAYPARKSIDGVTMTDGVAIISDDKFETSLTTATSLAGMPLTDLPYSALRGTYYGEFMLAARIGDLNGSDINETFRVNMPLYNPREISITDLNISDLAQRANLMREGFIEAGNHPDTSIRDANSSVYLIDLDMDGTIETNLFASTSRFSIFDNTYTKVFSNISNGSFVIKGIINEKANRISDINDLKSYTEVSYIDLGNSQFAISSSKVQDLDLLESSGYTIFKDNPKIIDEGNRTKAQGAIGKVYTHKNILSSTLIIDNYDGTLDAGEGIVNEATPFFIDLQGSPMWAPDFPNGGPINTFANFDKEITGILTMDSYNVGGGEDFWSITDVTKDPGTWFETRDSQQLFNIKKEKGYWLNIKNLLLNSLSIGQDVVYQKSSTPHFDNTITVVSGQNISPVTNHINHEFSIIVNGIDPTKNDSYNVSATIAGQNYPLRSVGSRFSLRINDWDMNLKESIEGVSSPDVIILDIFDGLGNKLKNSDTPISFAKPQRPTISWDSSGDLEITSVNPYEIHISPILDTDPDASIGLKNANNLQSIKSIGWANTEGNYTIVRVVAKNQTTNFYSDAQPVHYAPLKSGHILNVEDNRDSDVIPYSYISNGILKINGIESDSGMELTNLTDNRILMSYYPNEREGAQSLASFGGTTTMYLKIGTDVIGYITYIPTYHNKIFYIYYENNLYQGIFKEDNTHSYESNAYDLDGAGFGEKIEFNGYTTNSQPIIEPTNITQPDPGTGNTGNQNPQTGTNVPPSPQLLLPR